MLGRACGNETRGRGVLETGEGGVRDGVTAERSHRGGLPRWSAAPHRPRRQVRAHACTCPLSRGCGALHEDALGGVNSEMHEGAVSQGVIA